MSRKPRTSSQDLLDEVQIKCIGLIVAEWALLDAIVSMAIWKFCNLDRERGLSVTADLGSLARIKMLTSLARVHFGAYPEAAGALEELLEITREMEVLNGERNLVVHNIWLPHAPEKIGRCA